MLNFKEINQLVNQDHDVLDFLNIIYHIALRAYPHLSRFSVVTVRGDSASNYFVRDRLLVSANRELYSQRLSVFNSLNKMISNNSPRVINDLRMTTQNSRTVKLLSYGHRSGFSYPLVYKNKAVAIVFFNSTELNFFDDELIQNDLLLLSTIIHTLMVRQQKLRHFIHISLSIALKMGHDKDPETSAHLTRMECYSVKLAYLLTQNKAFEEAHVIDHEFIRLIECYAAFHDIGKYRIPDKILFSTAKFTAEERRIMESHCAHGLAIIEEVLAYFPDYLKNKREYQFLKHIVYYHHERFDGLGYPTGLKGKNIPLEARITMVADVFDALLSKRQYKDSWTLENTVSYMKKNAGNMFDPYCVDSLVSHLDQFVALHQVHADDA